MSVILGGNVHTLYINTKALIVGIEEIGLALHAEEVKHMVMCCGQHAG